MPKPCASRITWLPICPAPTTPNVLPYNSTPMKRPFSHLPPLVEAVAWGILRAMEQSSEKACSAVVMVLPPGVFITTIPRLVASGMLTLSNPLPARPITCRLSARAMSSSVALVELRTTNPL